MLKLLTCADAFLAGVGSPKVWGLSAGAGINATSNQGHGKRVAILPQGFAWAPAAAGWDQPLPKCVTDWSGWVARTPYGDRLPGAGDAPPSCSYTCTPDGIQQLVNTTGAHAHCGRLHALTDASRRHALAPVPRLLLLLPRAVLQARTTVGQKL